jgi:hypothetical protein
MKDKWVAQVEAYVLRKDGAFLARINIIKMLLQVHCQCF